MRRILFVFLLILALNGCNNNIIWHNDVSIGFNTIMYDNGELRYYEINSNKYIPWGRFYADNNYIYYENDGLWRCNKNLSNHTFFDKLPLNMTYPDIQPMMIEYAIENFNIESNER